MSWSKIRLGNFVKIRTGKLDANAQSANGQYPFFTCSRDNLKINTFSYDCECLLVAGNGDLNVKYYNGKFDAYQRTYIVESTNKNVLDVKYLYFFMSKFIEQLRRDSIGGVIKYIKVENLTEPKITLPDLPTQKHIASILDKADALRQQNRQLLNYYDELLQSTFIEMFGDPVTNNGGWAVKKLDEIAEVVSGVAKNTGLAGDLIEVPYMRVANVQDGALDLGEIKTIRVFKRDYEKYQLKSGDVLMTEGGDPDKLGRAAIWGEEIPDCIHQNHIFRVRPNYQIADSEFLCSQFGSIYGKKYFLRAAKQTTGIASINMTQLKNFPVLVPPIEMQKEFKDVMHKIRRQKEILSSEIIEQDMLFNTLLAKYFTNN